MIKLTFWALFLMIGAGGTAINTQAATINATSCSQSDVQAAINAANSSPDSDNTVLLPPCDIAWTIGTYINIGGNSSKVLHLLGAGKGVTRIKDFKMNPSGHMTNMVEWGNMTIWSDPSYANDTIRPISDSIRPYATGTELYWHDLEVLDYNAGFMFRLSGWIGVITRLTQRAVPCDKVARPGCQNPYGFYVDGSTPYDGKSASKIGTRNALFFENDTFINHTHAISGFCNSYYVVRHCTFIQEGGAATDIHGAGFNSCPYSNGTGTWATKDAGGGLEVYDNDFYQTADMSSAFGEGNAYMNPRAGSSMLIYNNRAHTNGYTPPAGIVQQYSDDGCRKPSSSGGQSLNCGIEAGQTCQRKYVSEETVTTPGCYQAPEGEYVWNNTTDDPTHTTVEFYRLADHGYSDPCDLCTQWEVNIFNHAPASYSAFTFPHPLDTAGRSGTVAPKAPSGLNIW
jgi:hypothetical protein